MIKILVAIRITEIRIRIAIRIATLVRRALAEVCTAPVLLVMAAVWIRAGRRHYIFALWLFVYMFLLSFFPRLISAVADWMTDVYTILPHMVWP